MNSINMSGLWQVRLSDGQAAQAALPGTLDENHIGHPDLDSSPWHPDANLSGSDDLRAGGTILTRLTRLVTYEGPAVFERTLCIEKPDDSRAFVTVERSRELSLALNGHPIPPAVRGTASTPYVFEITNHLLDGDNRFSFCCDNSYPTWPRNDILYSSAATDETQTNWNGILGRFTLDYQKPNFIRNVRVYPTLTEADVIVELDCQAVCRDVLTLQCDAFAQTVRKAVDLPSGVRELRIGHIPLRADCARWDIEDGNLYTLAVQADTLDVYSVRFGVRTFGTSHGRLMLNNRPIFLRSEANCCVFPQTGHMPLDIDGWMDVLQRYQAYGVNCMRFHSHCPPDAAFAAADRLGMLMQPELSHWNPRNALDDNKSFAYYPLELKQILRAYANHPSFVMLTFGNELHTGALGHARMDSMITRAKTLDSTRLYANGSNVHYGHLPPDPGSDFYTSSNYLDHMLRATSAQMQGFLNGQYPSADHTYTAAMTALRKDYIKPVFTFEVGQYEVLPDFAQLTQFTGVTRADNLAFIQSRMQAAGWAGTWKRRVEATGELALLGYREEVEAVLRTPSLSGISLLGLQDFPGQGTALVGMLDAHLKPKPYSFANPERFRAFFTDVLPLAQLPRYTYRQQERLQCEIQLANYGKAAFSQSATAVLSAGDTIFAEAVFPEKIYKAGTLTAAGRIDFPLQKVQTPQKLCLTITVGQACNRYPVWV
ncbi:MAG TPA: glycoside hydrolase family 2 TIM barrel-domain containing protein, partial [Candidatus Limiplasma sp.]|nr:glycoside hydrolase family 2 TIM barrel-domain containing protein [Candidatus Limiplasma sp.]